MWYHRTGWPPNAHLSHLQGYVLNRLTCLNTPVERRSAPRCSSAPLTSSCVSCWSELHHTALFPQAAPPQFLSEEDRSSDVDWGQRNSQEMRTIISLLQHCPVGHQFIVNQGTVGNIDEVPFMNHVVWGWIIYIILTDVAVWFTMVVGMGVCIWGSVNDVNVNDVIFASPNKDVPWHLGSLVLLAVASLERHSASFLTMCCDMLYCKTVFFIWPYCNFNIISINGALMD